MALQQQFGGGGLPVNNFVQQQSQPINPNNSSTDTASLLAAISQFGAPQPQMQMPVMPQLQQITDMGNQISAAVTKANEYRGGLGTQQFNGIQRSRY